MKEMVGHRDIKNLSKKRAVPRADGVLTLGFQMNSDETDCGAAKLDVFNLLNESCVFKMEI